MPNSILDYIEQYVRHFGEAPSAEEIWAFIDGSRPCPINRMLGAFQTYGERLLVDVRQRRAL